MCGMGMNTDDLIIALEMILDASVSSDALRAEILASIHGLREDIGSPPVKGILAMIQKANDLDVPEEIRAVIRDVAFNYV